MWHVSEIPALLTGEEKREGQCGAGDVVIAAWCVETSRILVAVDDDHTGRGGRAAALRDYGVEVVWFQRDPKGAEEHLRSVVQSLPGWRRVLGRCDRAPRVWVQHLNRREPALLEGKAKRRSRRRGDGA
jgi:hypothetical protein